MTDPTKPRLAIAATLLAVGTMAGCATQETEAPADYRGTDPGGKAEEISPPPSTDGMVTDGTDRYVVARNEDTVAILAVRHGLSASELAGYNGLTPDSKLFVGQDLVVPPGATYTAPRTVDGREGGSPAVDTDDGSPVAPVPLPGAGATAPVED